jgi:small ligand-binding sensory domain FIST
MRATCGGVASTVSSLSRARLFAYSADGPGSLSLAAVVHGDGLAGVALRGDVRADTLVAQGAKPMGGVYQVAAAEARGIGGKEATEKEDGYSQSTIRAIVLDEAATADEAAAGDAEEDEEDAEDGARAWRLAAYAKA